MLGIGMTLGVLQFGFLNLGVANGMSAGLSSLVLQFQAFFSLIFSALILKEKQKLQQWVGLALSFSGLWFFVSTMEFAGFVAFLFVLSASFFWAIGNLLLKKTNPDNAFSFMIWVSVVPPIPLLAASLFYEGYDAILHSLLQLNLYGVGATLYVSWIGTAFCYGAWGFLLRKHTLSTVAPFTLLVPISGMLLSAWILDETLSQREIIGCIFVFLGLTLNVIKFPNKLKKTKQKRPY